MKRIGMFLLMAALVAGFAIGGFLLNAPPAMTADQISDQLALNRLERYARPTGANVLAANTTSQITVTYGGADSDTCELVKAGGTITAYLYNGDSAYTDTGFDAIALGSTVTGLTNADVCNAIDALTDYECDPVQGGDYLGRAMLLDAATIDVSAGGVLDATTVYGITVVLPARGGHVSNHLMFSGGVMDGLTTPGQYYVYDGDSLAAGPVFARHLPDYDATKISDTELGLAYPWPGLIGSENEPMVIRVYAHEVWTDAALTVVSNYYGY